MPYCPNCGIEVSEDKSFCSKCGTRLNQSAEHQQALSNLGSKSAADEHALENSTQRVVKKLPHSVLVSLLCILVLAVAGTGFALLNPHPPSSSIVDQTASQEDSQTASGTIGSPYDEQDPSRASSPSQTGIEPVSEHASDSDNPTSQTAVSAFYIQGTYDTDRIVVSTDGSTLDLPVNYQVAGPVSEGLFMVRWINKTEDKWGVGTDGTFYCGFMDTSGQLAFTLEEVASSIDLPMKDAKDRQLQCDTGAFFENERAVLSCFYSKQDGSGYHFDLVVDREGNVIAWAGIDSNYIEIPNIDSFSYTSFSDPAGLDNFPQVSIARSYRSGLVRVGKSNSLSNGHTILLDEQGEVYADFFHDTEYPIIRSSSILNRNYGIASDIWLFSYAPGPDAKHSEILLDVDSLCDQEDFASAELVALVNDEDAAV
ncbi:MAG: zinc ribbon domain-containing protein, partial [Eggerthellaceae bacterium]|nr:zinc ribbon domain-containing protein [Eggerthellaceae bacterium]